MEIVQAHETGQENLDRKVRETFLNRTVVGCGHATFPPHFVAHVGERHLHEDDEVFIVLTGVITVPGGNARAGDWILVKAGEEHHLTNNTDLPCTVIFLMLK